MRAYWTGLEGRSSPRLRVHWGSSRPGWLGSFHNTNWSTRGSGAAETRTGACGAGGAPNTPSSTLSSCDGGGAGATSADGSHLPL